MPIFRIENHEVNQLSLTSFNNEKDLQQFVEKNMYKLLGIQFIASEFTIGGKQRGRIDTLGIDMNGDPTIIEFKHKANENIVTQGLYYLDWLVDHKGDFKVAAQEKLGQTIRIDWSNPRVLLIAEGFAEYDRYAVNRMDANIELWVYRLYENSLFYLEPIYLPPASNSLNDIKQGHTETEQEIITYTLEDHLKKKPERIKDLFHFLQDKIVELNDADEIIINITKVYIGYKRGKNFCEIELFQNYLRIWVDINPNNVNDPNHLGRDMTKIGHHGTGQYEIKLEDKKDIPEVIEIIKQAYQMTL